MRSSCPGRMEARSPSPIRPPAPSAPLRKPSSVAGGRLPVAARWTSIITNAVYASRLTEGSIRGGIARAPDYLRCSRHRARGAQTVDRVLIEAHLLENRLAVLADVRGALCRHFGDAVHLQRAADRGGQVSAGAL